MRKKHEFDDERLIRFGHDPSLFDYSFKHGFYKLHKNRKIDRNHFYENPKTELVECKKCGFLSIPRKVKYRYEYRNAVDFFLTVDVHKTVKKKGWAELKAEKYGSTLEEFINNREKLSILCIGCFNKVMPAIKSLNEYIELRDLTNKLRRNIDEKKRNQNNRAASHNAC